VGDGDFDVDGCPLPLTEEGEAGVCFIDFRRGRVSMRLPMTEASDLRNRGEE
jgi:hypothetical protein